MLTGTVSYAQKQLTIQDALVNNRTTLAPENLRQLQFVKGTDDYVYLKKINGTDTWVRGNFKTGETSYLTLTQFNQRLRKALLDTLITLPPIQFNNENWIVSIKGQRYAFNASDTNYKKLIDKNISAKTNFTESSAGYIAFIEDHNLYVTDSSKEGSEKIIVENGNTLYLRMDHRQITNDGSEDIVYASPVHQQEFGITKGTFWSNNGKILAFYRMDQSMVPAYPIIDWSQRPAKAINVKYPMAGDSSHHVTVGVYNAVTKSLVWLNTGVPAEQYLTNVAWSPDDKYIYIAVLNRGQDHMKLNQYDAGTGAFVKTLFEEKHDKYVEPLVPMLFVKNRPAEFIWQSRKDGWNHLYLYSTSGELIRQLTAGQWDVTEVKGFDAKGENLFYVSTKESPLSKNLYTVNLKSAKSKNITLGNNVHTTMVSSTGNSVIDNFSSPDNPRTIRLIETNTGKANLLLQAPNPLTGYQLGSMNIFTIKASDGTDLYCRMFKAVDFDSTKKYPVIVYWYGGPHAQMILNSWNGGAGDYWFQYMAERGFVVFTLDTRGSSNRGRAFEQSIFREAGKAQMQDLEQGVNYLNALPYTDKSRMGLFGWSYGGFMTTNFILNHPGVFKAGVAGGPVMDWKYYEIMYTERYMDTPKENPAGYDASDLIKQAGKLKDKLLLIHGLQDPVVVQQHSVNFVRAAIDKGVQVDYMIYPGHEHNVLGKDRAHLYQKITDYFMLHLK
jgi:dipeptidyl-peptidase-4